MRQCELIRLPRSSWYYEPQPETEENLGLMRLLDEQYTRTPFYGSRRMVTELLKGSIAAATAPPSPRNASRRVVVAIQIPPVVSAKRAVGYPWRARRHQGGKAVTKPSYDARP